VALEAGPLSPLKPGSYFPHSSDYPPETLRTRSLLVISDVKVAIGVHGHA